MTGGLVVFERDSATPLCRQGADPVASIFTPLAAGLTYPGGVIQDERAKSFHEPEGNDAWLAQNFQYSGVTSPKRLRQLERKGPPRPLRAARPRRRWKSGW